MSATPDNEQLHKTTENVVKNVNDVSSKNDSLGTAPQGIREQMVDTAVRFLQNSKVQGSSDQIKETFLKKKGLTDAEVSAAFARVGDPPRPAVPEGSVPAPRGQLMLPYHPAYHLSLSERVRELVNFVILIAGASYGANYLWKKYISPWIFGISPPKEKKDKILDTAQTVLEAVTKLQSSVLELKTALDTYAAKAKETQVVQEDKSELQELKSEIQSVKGLMLSSRQFPSHPAVGGTTSVPSIPAWQLEPEQADISPDVVPAAESDKANGSHNSSSEIEMISHDNSSEEGGH